LLNLGVGPLQSPISLRPRGEFHEYDGPPEEFTLPISTILLDPIGVNMAIIADRILTKGWWTDGFVQHEGYRLFRYKAVPLEIQA
jgi:hypothetical protein